MSSAAVSLAEKLLAALSPSEALEAGAAARILDLQRLSGGANMETWSFDLAVGEAREPLILRRVPGQFNKSEKDWNGLAVADEAALVTAADAAGVPAPRVRQVLCSADALGEGYIMSREPGEALPQRLLGEDRYRDARAGLAFQCGAALGRIHQVPLDVLPRGLPDYSGDRLFLHVQQLLDAHDNDSPVLQLALGWLRDNRPPGARRTLVHGDFRNGNLLVDEGGLVAVLDWELAHLGDPVSDLGYLSANVWRFGASPPVGGFGEYADLLAGYASVTGASPAMDEILYWQVYAALFWGTVCITMLGKFRSGEDTSLERAAIGRRLSEAEIDLLLLLDGKLP